MFDHKGINVAQGDLSDKEGHGLADENDRTVNYLAEGNPSDKEGHGSTDVNDNDSAGKAKNSKRDFEQRPDVAGNIEQPHNKLRYTSKYLVQFVPDAKPQTSETPVRISGARVLTDDKCVAILKEAKAAAGGQGAEEGRKRAAENG